MSRMSELIYPDAPGFKVHGASEDAAKQIGGKTKQMLAAVLAEFAKRPCGATADEVAKALNMSVLSIRPRVSELRRTGKIKQTGTRRTNDSGMTATVWRIVHGPR
jgi:predicted ArsR family transcriptional regulator